MNYIIKKYPLTTGKNCMLASIKDILNYYGINIIESDLYFICKGLCFTFNPASKAKLISDRFDYDCYQYIIENVSAFFNCNMIFNYSLEDIQIKELLKNDIPVIVLMDPRIVPYNNRILNPVGHQEMHSTVLYGYDDNMQSYFVADATVADDSGLISALWTSMDMKFLQENTKGFFYITSISNKTYDANMVKIKIRDTINEFIYPNDNENVYTGANAVKQLFNLLLYEEDYINEVKFLFQAYFVPLFTYLKGSLYHFNLQEGLEMELAKEKNKWDVLYYKYLLKLKKNISEGDLYNALNKYFDTLIDLLISMLGDWNKQINNYN